MGERPEFGWMCGSEGRRTVGGGLPSVQPQRRTQPILGELDEFSELSCLRDQGSRCFSPPDQAVPWEGTILGRTVLTVSLPQSSSSGNECVPQS